VIFNTDFFCGYSPERINPGDKTRDLPNIVKITSGSSKEAAAFIDATYKKIILAGTYLAPSIKVAEAAKVIENTQRDLNIALVNELAIIFNKLDIDTQDVLQAASTKWNFMPFTPGLVGGHCIGVDPYYLTSKAQDSGYHPTMILAGRSLNDGMATYVANALLDKLCSSNIVLEGAKVLILGFTFKENCADFRNTKVVDLASELERAVSVVEVYDPYIKVVGAHHGIKEFVNFRTMSSDYDAIIIAVAHDEFKEMGILRIKSLGKPGVLVYDLKWVFDAEDTELRL
jgi:UDP-N-acetyl-D-galactosamine dehydrogenase